MGDEPTLAETPSLDTVPCRQCRTLISANAKLCRYCSSYQDWRGHLHVSSAVLALLVALVSVLSVTLPAIVGALRPSHSRIVLSSPVIRGEAVYVVASNLGSKPGVIQRGLIHSDYLGMDSELELINPGEAFVAPGAKQVGLRVRLRLSAEDALFQRLKASLDAMRGSARGQAGHIGIWEQGSDGQGRYVRLAVTYEDIVTLLEAHAARCKAATAPPTIDNGCLGIDELRDETDRKVRELEEALRGAERSQPKRERGRVEPTDGR
jgi:ribosomal protein L40E